MTDQTQTRMTRREALKGGSAAAVAAGAYLMQEQLVQAASAQTNEPRIQLGQDYVIDDDPGGNGDLVIEHLPSGAEFRYDSSVDAWVPTGQIGDGTTSANHGSVTTGQLTLNDKVVDDTLSFNGGQTRGFNLGTGSGGDVDPSPGDRFFVSAVPNNEPGNDHGYTVENIRWVSGASVMQVSVTETQNAGGGEARIVGWRIRV